MQLGLPNLAYNIVLWRNLEIHLFWDQKVKSQGHNVYVGLQTECNVATIAYISHAGFSLL